MDSFNNCPRCGNLVHKVAETHICECGWSVSSAKDPSQKGIVLSLFMIAGVIAGVGFHVFQWGGYSLSVFTAPPQKMVSICMDLKKYDCVESNYRKLYNQTNDNDHLEQLGEFQFKREHYEDSYNTYKLYFAQGGKNEKATYYYAHALAKVGEIDQAIPYFESIIKGRSGVLVVTVIESYLQVLVSYNRINKAKEVLSWAKKVSNNSSSQRHIEKWQKQFKI